MTDFERFSDRKELGHYQLLSRLGEGGMGSVYLAQDTKLGRKVALKFLQPAFLTEEGKRRFLREARSAAALDHPKICTIYETGEADGAPYLAMQYIQGETLRGALAAGALDLAARLEIAIQIAGALQAAHAQGIVHRDIKPANILITPARQAKVLDFGLAKVARDQDDMVSPKTETGTIAGTRPYMSPEQLRGDDVDARSDLFSFGVMLYEMFLGQRPFDRATAEATIAAILFADPPPLARAQATPLLKRIEKIIRRALQKERGGRYASAAEIERELVACRPLIQDAATQRMRTREAADATETMVLTAKRKSRARLSSVAMLRPHNVSNDAELEYVVQGIGEEVIREISRIPRLRVIAPGSSLRATDRDPLDVGRGFGVDAVVVSELRRIGGELELRASLIRCAGGERLWVGELRAPAIEPQRIAAELADAVRAKAPGRRRAPTRAARPDPAAMQLYLKGRHQWAKRTPDGIRASIEHFRGAIEIAPLDARAYAGLADAYNLLGFTTALPPRDVFPKARAAATRAIEIDPSASEAHAALACAIALYDLDFPAAEALFDRSIALDPNYSWAHHWRGLTTIMPQRRFEEALEAVQRAAELDPLTTMMHVGIGVVLHYARRYDEALRVYRNLLAADADHAAVRYYAALSCEQLGLLDEAVAHIERAEELGGRALMYGAHVHILAAAGRRAEAEAVAARLDEYGREHYVSAYSLAIVREGFGDHDGAVAMLERAFEERASWLSMLPLDPRLDSIRQQPRVVEVARQHGLAL